MKASLMKDFSNSPLHILDYVEPGHDFLLTRLASLWQNGH
jgi:hypothetical protein